MKLLAVLRECNLALQNIPQGFAYSPRPGLRDDVRAAIASAEVEQPRTGTGNDPDYRPGKDLNDLADFAEAREAGKAAEALLRVREYVQRCEVLESCCTAMLADTTINDNRPDYCASVEVEYLDKIKKCIAGEHVVDPRVPALRLAIAAAVRRLDQASGVGAVGSCEGTKLILADIAGALVLAVEKTGKP